MNPKENIPTQPKIVAIFQKMIADKKMINDHLANGGKISALKAKGFKFVKPI
ncbi:hypothetical protein [Chitinophaga nivalis]|uniref:Uncharacterized protein n=1 Tax=Chitinophaga nivalis TaxID=2991709 RepID=A0ABT3ITL4_9BACT|nr:hypothetical protein [Chitinophaga nivalis]MCW3463266.1 hypothetical protein [Chitinophaga nivalis]MCW3487044.1 hypothetical protein [Chitinophaga nivalis]